MEDFQRVGDALAQAINEGNIEEAARLIQEAASLDAEFEVYCEQSGNNAVIVEEHKVEPKPKLNNGEIYEKLIEMGVDRDKALSLAGKCKSIDEAINNAFS